MKEKPFLSTTLCKVDRVLTLGQSPCIKVCYFPSPPHLPLPMDKDSFCHRGESKLKIRLFIHELLREPLIVYFVYLLRVNGTYC